MWYHDTRASLIYLHVLPQKNNDYTATVCIPANNDPVLSLIKEMYHLATKNTLVNTRTTLQTHNIGGESVVSTPIGKKFQQ